MREKNMMIPDRIIFFALGIVFVTILLSGVLLKRKKRDFFGADPIHPILYKTGKACSFFVWITLFIVSIHPDLLRVFPGLVIYPAGWMRWSAASLSASAAVLIFLSFITLGESLKFGLPRNETGRFIRRGLYRFSRNPMYLSFAVIDGAAFIFIPSLCILIPAAIAVYVHRRIILAEETYMLETWGERYREYLETVKRYV